MENKPKKHTYIACRIEHFLGPGMAASLSTYEN